MPQHAQPNSSTAQNLPSFCSDIPISLTPSSGIETSFTVHSYPRSTHFFGDQESVSSSSATNPTDFPYHTLENNSRHPTPDLYHCALKSDNQSISQPKHYLRYHILPVNRTNKKLQYSAIIRNREMTKITHTSIQLKFEVTVKLIGLQADPIPNSNQIKHRTFPIHLL